MAWDGFTQAICSRKGIWMVLETISIGCAVPRTDFDATVHSVFQSAINMRPLRENELLTLVSSSGPDLPQGIRVNAPDNIFLNKFYAGQPVTFRGDTLRIGSLTIGLHSALCWKCNLPALHADFTNPDVVASWRSAWLALNKRQIQWNAEIIAERLFRTNGMQPASGAGKAGEAMRSLVEATRHYDLLVESSVCGLIGLGTGLTPYGDDLLVGYLAGLWCTVRDEHARVQFISNLGEIIIRHAHQTNDISRTYLMQSSRGQVSSLLSNLSEAICKGENSDRLLNTVEAAMRVGHTSGMDIMTGLLIGLTTWDRVNFCIAENLPKKS